MRQHMKWMGILFILAALLIGCGNNDDGEQAPVDSSPETNDANDTGDVNNTTPDNDDDKNDTSTHDETVIDAPYSFIDLEIDVDINGVENVIEVEYEVERSRIDASYENKDLNIDLEDEQAMAELEPILNTFTFDENSSDEEILEQVLDGFSIDAYDEIEIEVTFKDQTKVKIER